MSANVACSCEPRDRKAWVVTKRNCHRSAFSGYRWTHSDYSEVHCTACKGVWRTKARYVDELPSGSLR